MDQSQTPQGGDKPAEGTTDQTVEEQFAALLEIEDNPPDPQTPPEDADGDDEQHDDDADDDAGADEGDDDAQGEEEDADEQDDDDDDDDEKGTEDELLFEVIIDGEKQEVESAELVAGYQRQQDYSRKTAALAEERKAFNDERQGVQQERAKYANLLDKLEKTIEDAQPAEPDWDKLRRADPSAYNLQRAEWNDRQDKLKAIKAEKEATLRKQQEDDFTSLQDFVAGERQKLVEAVPEWADQKAMQAGQQELVAYMMQTGWTEEDIGQMVDHRAVLALRKAMLYDQLQQKKPVVRKKAKGAPVVKPGAKKRSKPKANKLQSAKEQQVQAGGTTDATAAAFYAMLEGEG